MTSGSVWLGLPLYYQSLDSVEDYLGQTLPLQNMTPEALVDKAGTGLRRLAHFRKYPKGHKGPEEARRLRGHERESEEESEASGIWEGLLGCPADEGWCACIVERFQPGSLHGLYSTLPGVSLNITLIS